MSNLNLPCSVQQKFVQLCHYGTEHLMTVLQRVNFIKKERKCQNDKDDIFIESYTILRLVMLASS